MTIRKKYTLKEHIWMILVINLRLVAYIKEVILTNFNQEEESFLDQILVIDLKLK